ncbi:MAG: DUF3877 family protein [Eubacterium sp.]|nr:DUF3877 family protein [Eubacterium sp.]
MNTKKLEQNIMDTVTEQQLKLGYRFEHVRIYYPLQTLNRLLGVEKNASQMEDMLSCFCDAIKDKYGPIRISVKEDRFCFLIPPEGNEYIHSHGTDNGFLEELIHTVSHHGCQLEEILSLFHKYSDHVHIEQTKHGEFDYLVYFEDGVPDSFRYCLSVEEAHIIYHRFTPEDYQDFGL